MSNAPLLANESSPGGGAVTIVGALKDDKAGETRVALTPTLAKQFLSDGYKVVIESGAGNCAGYFDNLYTAVGCEVAARGAVMSSAHILFVINPPVADFAKLKSKMVVSWVGRLQPAGKEICKSAASAGVDLVDVTAVPRITIAQKLDVISSQAKVAGVRAVMEAAHAYGRFQTGEMTAAGKYNPSQTLVLGCGVAGLAAIGMACKLGSVTRAWDVRDVSDQVISLGAGWVTVDFNEDGAGAGGYAKESSPAFAKAQKETFHKLCKEVDIIITTAAIPGRDAPKLIEDYMVKDMKPGSVIVDLAAIGGGNCVQTRRGEKYTTSNGVTIIGYDSMPGLMPEQSSEMYAHNMINFVRHVAGKEKAAGFLKNFYQEIDKGDDGGDIIPRSMLCTRGGQELVMPPPPQPTPPKPKAPPKTKEAKKEASPRRQACSSAFTLAVGCLVLVLVGTGVADAQLATFLLSGAAGYQVVWGVAHALHTPLMSVTNAISGSTAIGGFVLLNKALVSNVGEGGDANTTHGGANTGDNVVVLWLAGISTFVSCVNIFGGFVVTRRMLGLFKRAGDQDFSYYLLFPGLVLVGCAFAKHDFQGPVSIVAAFLCILAIGGLATMKNAASGCVMGIVGVGAACTTTLLEVGPGAQQYGVVLLVAGAIVGMCIGCKVEPMALPQTVAAFHSLVGTAAMLSSIGDFVQDPQPGLHMRNVFAILGDAIGAITLTGSLVAFGKLNGNLGSGALNLPCKNLLNLLCLFTYFGLVYVFLTTDDADLAVNILWGVAGLCCFMGYHLVASVGGGDMPVCITVLNSYSGWALVSEGFMLDNTLLTIVGSLIGFSGGILTKIMCDGMNRDILNVIFGGMNVAAPTKKDGDLEAPKVHVEATVDVIAEALSGSKQVLIVPGYGMAAGRAQGPVADVARVLVENDVRVRFGIHPVAGRMPGQMNVLLAEAGVPYDWVEEMDEVNPDMDDFDVCLVIGANDITNSAAQESDTSCPIYGMPVIEVWRAKKCFFFKRSMAGGYADIENPVFFKPTTEMMLGNAKSTCEKLAVKLKENFAANK